MNMAKGRTIPLPKGKYVAQIEVNKDNLHVQFKKRKKISLLFVCLNQHYWPYICQIVKDAKQHFMPQHQVEFLVWSDIKRFPAMKQETLRALNAITGTNPDDNQAMADLLITLLIGCAAFPETTAITKTLESQHVFLRHDASKKWLESSVFQGETDPGKRVRESVRQAILSLLDVFEANYHFLIENTTVIDTDPVEWPAPTLMRYHLFLNEEAKLKESDYLFYLDADMRMVQKVSDEILGPSLTAAPHPGYAISKKYIPPYEPNPVSEAYIPRLGYLADEGGKKRFIPFYAAGGFQGGKTEAFIRAMKQMKKGIDTDFNKNYTAIWNDESHWNKYLWDHQAKGGNITFLDVSYIYPDSLIKEFYEPLWGRSYEPKIITLTKPFSLKGSEGLQEIINQRPLV
jgi:hypothetical protein